MTVNSATTTPTTTSTTGTTSSSTTSSAATNGLASLADNYQTFLTLLTTQLQNQDPTSPLDTSQFTSQLTQMTGVEQQLLSNQLLQQLVTAQGGLSQAAGLIGKTITAPGATSTASPITGVVTGVQEVNGQTELSVGGSTIAMSSVTGVTN
jgi:flagellar basal-body rod modification protein FlgD